MADEGAILTEAFTPWVIEDDFAGARPRWEAPARQPGNARSARRVVPTCARADAPGR
ncbi:MAG: hypothetical protein ACKO1O_03255 [Erythrobacter sp.]